MIHILLMILKIIGIILLVILGLLLFILLAVLFVPIRYKAQGSWHEQPVAALRMSWFLHLLSVRAKYSKEGLVIGVRVLGYDVLKKRNKDVAEAVKGGAEDILGEEDQSLYDELQEDEARYQKAAEDRASRKESGDRNDRKKNVDGEDASVLEETDAVAPEGGTLRTKAPEHKTQYQDDPQLKDKTQPKDTSGICEKLRSLLKGIVARITGLWKKLKFSFASFCGKLKGIQTFVQDKRLWLEDEKNQASIKLLLRQTRRLIAHIWPVKGEGTVTFGFDDPYTTGQVLQAISLIYPFYHKRLSVYPVFDDKVLDAEGSFRGRIQLAFVLWLALQIFMDKHTRRMIRGFIK